jgi:mRNA-degrading endonuclease RelE of RelBE toxin-antitoxin system
LRLRVGDWRVIFERLPQHQIRVLRVLHRSEAYR